MAGRKRWDAAQKVGLRSGSACLSAGELMYRVSGSDRKFPALTGRSGTQRARRPRSRIPKAGASMQKCSLTWAFAVERVTGIEPALSLGNLCRPGCCTA
jgi:hypothetical protein